MRKAVFLDFYGTIVNESYALLDHIADEFKACGAKEERAEIVRLWWQYFREECGAAHGAAFRRQRELYPVVFARMAARTGASVDVAVLQKAVIAFSVQAEIFPDARRFLEECPLPYYIVSNIDNAELEKVLALHALSPAGVYTSEDARAYKPRREVFSGALRAFGLTPEAVVFAGDSLRNDYYGAEAAGLRAFWIDRLQEGAEENVRRLPDLYSLLAEVGEHAGG